MSTDCTYSLSISTMLRVFSLQEVMHSPNTELSMVHAVPDLPLCLDVLLAQGLVGQGRPIFLPKKPPFYDGFLLMWCNLKFLAIPEHVCLTACVGLPSLPPSGPM